MGKSKKYLIASIMLLFILLIGQSFAQDFSNVYISGYVEGSGYNKAIEITNVTGAALDMSDYSLEIYNNGETTPSIIHVSGNINNKSVFVIVHPTAGQELLDLADTTTGALNMNGNDVLVLKKDGVVVDRIGQVGNSQYYAKDVTFVRKNTTKDLDINSNYEPSDYFLEYGKDNFTGIGVLEEVLVPLEKYTVNFDSAGGSLVASVEVEENEVLTQPAEPTQEGYTFEHWMLDGTEYDFSQPVTKDLTLVAKWEKIPAKKYTVNFDSAGGSLVASVEVEENEVLTQPVDPTREGYTFEHWMLDGTEYDFSQPVTKDLTLVAKWKEIDSSVDAGVKPIEPQKPNNEQVQPDNTILTTKKIDSQAKLPNTGERSKSFAMFGWMFLLVAMIIILYNRKTNEGYSK